MSIRINKYLADHGYCSRRGADSLISAGRVTINGKPAKLGDRVEDRDNVIVEGREQKERPKTTLIMLNKPVGMIVTTDTSVHNNVIDYLNYPDRLFPIGRLDVASSGLLLLTNDGELANRLMHPRYEHEKEYVVELEQPISNSDLDQLRHGVELDDGMTLPTDIKRLSKKRFSIVLKEGRNRQIRRMCEAIGHKIIRLHRTRIANLPLRNLPLGKSKQISAKTFDHLK